MREIKFRVFDSKQGRFLKIHDFINETWQFNGVAGCGNIGVLAYQIRENGELDFKLIYDERFKIEQYTGLKDYNNKEIYEGDIIEYSLNPFESVKGGVEFDYGAFYLKIGGERYNNILLADMDLDMVEVIDNFYQNKDLLK